jgi:predicted RNase H-like HicB family nuclease
MIKTITAAIWREDDGYVSLCSELDIDSQGDTVEEARANLREAVELFFETAHPNEIKDRLSQEIYFSSLEDAFGLTGNIFFPRT